VDLGIAGRSCVVTGASRGIGLATARMLGEAGAEVLLVSRDQDDLDAALACCPGSAAALSLDVTAPDAAERILEASGGRIEILVNNAGTARRRELQDVPEADWYAAFELNVMAPKRLIDAALPAMVEAGWGRVVNVSSSAAKRPSPAMAEYSVAKAGQLSLSRVYADRYAGDGVLVNAICPGPTRTEMWTLPGGLAEQAGGSGEPERQQEVLASIGAKRPIGRVAEAEEIAGAIAFLCSERASYVAGAAWSVDGGSVPVII